MQLTKDAVALMVKGFSTIFVGPFGMEELMLHIQCRFVIFPIEFNEFNNYLAWNSMPGFNK